MRKPFTIILMCSMLAFLPSYSWAKNNEKSVPGASVGVQNMEAGAWRGSQLMGINAYGVDGSRIGTIADIVGDVKGQVVYVILSVGGVLGIGNKLVPLPWEMVIPGEKPGSLKVQLRKEDLEQAPNFDHNNWPDFNKSEWKTKTQKYYETLRTKTKGKSN